MIEKGEAIMNYEEIVEILAPCGLNCQKCVAYSKGHVKHAAQKLDSFLGNFDSYAERYSNFYPVFKNYQAFKDMLAYFSEADCKGCREGHCKYPDCQVASCNELKEKVMDYCFQCDSFPCEKHGLHADLERRWRERNLRMREIGVNAYYDESKDVPRYQ